jgi:hypothetical protein
MLPLAVILLLGVPAALVAWATHRERAREDRANEDERLRDPGEFRRWYEHQRIDASGVLVALRDRRDRAEHRAAKLTGVAAGIGKALPGDGETARAWVVVAAAGVGAVWAFAFFNEVTVDAVALAGIGYEPAVATSLAMLIALGFSVFGIALWDLVGFTHLFPPLERLGRRVRWAAIAYVVILLVVGLSQLPGIAEYRSEPVAAKVRALEQSRAVLAEDAEPGDPLLHAVDEDLAAATERLQTAHHADRFIAIGAAAVEVLTSWALAWLALLAGLALALLLAAGARRGVARSRVREGEHDIAFRARIAQQAERSGHTPETLAALFGGAPDPSPEPPPPPPTGEDHPDAPGPWGAI